MKPLFPIPVTTTRPAQASTQSTARRTSDPDERQLLPTGMFCLQHLAGVGQVLLRTPVRGARAPTGQLGHLATETHWGGLYQTHALRGNGVARRVF